MKNLIVVILLSFAFGLMVSCSWGEVKIPDLPKIQAGEYRATFVEAVSSSMVLVASPVDRKDLILHGKNAVFVWAIHLPCLRSPLLGLKADEGRKFWKDRVSFGDDILLEISEKSPCTAALPIEAEIVVGGKRMKPRILAAGLAVLLEGCEG